MLQKDVSLWRVSGRKHDEVVTHLSTDDGENVLCGRDTGDLAWDVDIETHEVNLTMGVGISIHSRYTTIHRICRKCLAKLDKKE